MAKDLVKLKDAEQELNDWVVQWDSEKRHEHDGWDIKYPELEFYNLMEIEDEVARLLKEKYVRCPQEDLETPDGKVKAYRKE